MKKTLKNAHFSHVIKTYRKTLKNVLKKYRICLFLELLGFFFVDLYNFEMAINNCKTILQNFKNI